MTPLVEVADLHVSFETPRGVVHAVNGVDFNLAGGEVLGILGESGSGKSVMLRALLRLLPERRTSIRGQIRVAGADVMAMNRRVLREYRGSVVSMVFQDPMLALDPVFTIGEQIAEAVVAHRGVDRQTARRRALELLELVHIPSPKRRLDAYAHEMSGGMRQRAMIAVALSCEPKLLLADEPTTALDATVQMQLLLLLRRLQHDLGMSVIFVTHDVGVAVEVSDRISVMYAGRIVEQDDVREVIRAPLHPYTKGLLAATRRPVGYEVPLPTIGGSPPDLTELPPGCAFAPRCPMAIARCLQEPSPPMEPVGARRVACWRAHDQAKEPQKPLSYVSPVSGKQS